MTSSTSTLPPPTSPWLPMIARWTALLPYVTLEERMRIWRDMAIIGKVTQ